MVRKFYTIQGSKEEHSVILVFGSDEEVIDFSCTCKYMSFNYWSKKNQERKTICRHILEALAEEEKFMPLEWQTRRNLVLMKGFIKSVAFVNKCNELLRKKQEKDLEIQNLEKITPIMENVE